MFRLVASPTFLADVQLSVPGQDRPETVRITFRHKTRRDLAAYQARAVELAMQSGDDGSDALYADYVAEVIETWAGVGDADGAPIPYNRSNLERLLQQFPASGPEIVRAYARQLSHARAGN